MAEIRLNEEEYYRKAYGAWLGKNIGGTLGEPVEGRKERLDLEFYPELPGEFDTTNSTHYPDSIDDGEPTPLANDDLDLQLIWLHAIEQYGVDLGARELGQEWIDHVFFPYNEYRYALANLRRGIEPPVSGWFNNQFYNDCMGAPIRSEIWALIAPGAPDVATAYAYQDAIVDHAGGEGVYGEMFNAAVESAAFVENDPHRLIDVGLSYIPDDCDIASAVRDTVAWHEEEHDWETIRDFILEEYGHPDMTNAPQNFAFVILGWLVGDDFGDALLTCVNCGYDTDSSGATIGSLLGILNGRDGIPDEWIEPIGHRVVTRPQVRGFPAPDDLGELTDRTLAAARAVIAVHDLPVRIESDAATDVPADPVDILTDVDQRFDPEPLWMADPRINTHPVPKGSREDPTLLVTLDFGDEGPAIEAGGTKELNVTVENLSSDAWQGTLDIGLPEGWVGPDPRPYELGVGDELTWTPTVRANDEVEPSNELALEIERLHDGSPWATRTIEFTLVAAAHWRLEGPTGEETEVAFPDNRIAISKELDETVSGTYVARSTLVNPQDRTMQLEVHTSAAVTVRIDGSVVFEKTAEPIPDMLAGSPSYGTSEEGFNLAAGDHDLTIEFEREDDKALTAYVIPAATGVTDSPGAYYFLTDILFK